MQFNKFILSVIALAAVSVSASPSPSSSTIAKPLSEKAHVAPSTDIAQSCTDGCPGYCGSKGYAWWECCGSTCSCVSP
ncbi:hypothetical protein PILCRDRAFT_825272 [Piloderma croceum F 1598]|uniref:Invertebrate defensins family profile domain-containing protein n=1 Tax=Piloderma croceum (strain F 1598) TaxID=765440 RepID=A0A0C3FCA8_PILCF|nr:hypothetical protein PILCRDRAFT_825272 [Piloderma croceum F 1598]